MTDVASSALRSISTAPATRARVLPADESAAWRTHGKGAHRRTDGVHVLRLAGSFREMGEQHGALLRDEVRRGPMPYYRAHFTKLVGRSQLGPLTNLVWPALQLLIGRKVGKRLPDFARQTVEGLAAGAGMSTEELLDGATMPDALLWLASRMMDLRAPGPAVAHRISLGLGCTSAIAWGDATTDGKLLHARNFDYHGVSCWPQQAAVIFHEPDQGQRYVSVASAGVPLGGITAMNEAGLSLTVHQHMFTDRASLGGTPIGVVGDIVMRNAKSIGEAEAILAAHKPIGCWTYLVTDANTKQVLCWEENPDRHVAHRPAPERGTFGYANVYLDPELGETEVNLYGSYWRHNEARHRQANALLTKRHGALDAQAMAEILADPGPDGCRISEAISMVMTVASVVFKPEDGVVWVGTGDSPTSGGSFVPFSLDAADADPRQGGLTTTNRESPEARQAFEHYRRAYVAYLDEHDVPKARAEMDAARRIAPEQPLYHFLSGLCSLQQGANDAAIDAMSRAIELGHPHEERRAAMHLWRARAYAQAGRRRDAIFDWRRALSLRADRAVHDAARKDIKKGWNATRAERMQVDFSMADVAMP
ncbi:MAG: C45 family autoproteolytic acyltransferase/hydrolase [Myxococcota bacterium]|nr:C45 family autoproteolytic acyltransferase/hydrolase [Myxococcota bacterium]